MSFFNSKNNKDKIIVKEKSSNDLDKKMEERRKKREGERAIRSLSEEDIEKILQLQLGEDDVKLYSKENKREASSQKRIEKSLKEDVVRARKEIEKAKEQANKTKQRQEKSIGALDKKSEKEERKKAAQEKKLQIKEEAKSQKKEEKDKKRREKQKKKENSLLNRYRSYRAEKFALSDQKYYEAEERAKEKELRLAREVTNKRRADKLQDRDDRLAYKEEIQQRKRNIIEREQQRAMEMARKREARIAETINRRKRRNRDVFFHEKAYIDCVAERERILQNRGTKRLEERNQKTYYRSLPREERKARKEEHKTEQRVLREEYLRNREDIINNNRGLEKKLQDKVPCKKPGNFISRLRHRYRCYVAKRTISPVRLKHIIINQMAIMSNRAGFVIDKMDRKSDQVDDITTSIKAAIKFRLDRIRILSDRHKQGLLGSLAGLVIVLILATSFFNFVTGYEYAYNERTLGLVKNQEDVLILVDVLNRQLSKEHEALIAIDKNKDISFNRVFIMGKEIDDNEKVLRRLTYMRDLPAKGSAIFIEGTRVAVLNDKEESERVLDLVLNHYLSTSKNTEYESVGFAEKIEIKEIDTKLGRIENIDDVVNKILTGGSQISSHTVEAGETFASIAKKYNITQSQLLATNPDVSIQQLEIGQTLKLSTLVPMVKVQTVEITRYIEYTPYSTTYQDDKNTWEGERTVKVPGKNGEREVVAKIVRNNGVETAKMILEERPSAQPVTEVILVGTKPPPPLKGTGTFIYPVTNYTLTSKFGTRWGRLHAGIDMGAPIGTKIRASDGGTVILSRYNGQLGYCVEIDHGGNLVTVYGHCSKLYVTEGEQVFQGQHIADVGSTGRSTGAHLHFEVRVSGIARNPFEFL